MSVLPAGNGRRPGEVLIQPSLPLSLGDFLLRWEDDRNLGPDGRSHCDTLNIEHDLTRSGTKRKRLQEYISKEDVPTKHYWILTKGGEKAEKPAIPSGPAHPPPLVFPCGCGIISHTHPPGLPNLTPDWLTFIHYVGKAPFLPSRPSHIRHDYFWHTPCLDLAGGAFWDAA